MCIQYMHIVYAYLVFESQICTDYSCRNHVSETKKTKITIYKCCQSCAHQPCRETFGSLTSTWDPLRKIPKHGHGAPQCGRCTCLHQAFKCFYSCKSVNIT